MYDLLSLFKNYDREWVIYEEYEIKTAKDGHEYVTAKTNQGAGLMDEYMDPERMVLEALRVGMICLKEKQEEVIRRAVLRFISIYGPLGFITALPSTSHFLSDEKVYFPTNGFIKDRSMDTKKFINMFFPFEEPTSLIRESKYINMSDPFAEFMEFKRRKASPERCLICQRQYAERYDWLVTQFKDWAFVMTTTEFYCDLQDKMGMDERSLLEHGMMAYKGVTPEYHLELHGDLELHWDFNSLMQRIQLIYYMMMTHEKYRIRECLRCGRLFIAHKGDPGGLYCCSLCREVDEAAIQAHHKRPADFRYL